MVLRWKKRLPVPVLIYNFIVRLTIISSIMEGQQWSKDRSAAERIQSIKSTIAKLKELGGKMEHRGVEKINSVAMFEVVIKHPQKVTIHLGGEYYAEVLTQDAVRVLQHRLALLEAAAKEAVERQQREEEERGQKVRVQKDGNLTGIVECVGEEGGQEVFNIVEIEEENQPETNTPVAKDKQEDVNVPVDASKEQPLQYAEQEADRKASGSEEERQSSEDSEGEGTFDIINDAKVKIRREMTSGQPQKRHSLNLTSTVSASEAEAPPIQRRVKKMKTVSFELDQVKEEKDDTGPTPKPEPLPSKPKIAEVKDKKHESKSGGEGEKKMSRFKLQRMKQRLQSGLE